MGQTSDRLVAPALSRMPRSTVRNHEGTPEMLVTFSCIEASISAGSLRVQSAIRATSR